MKEFEEILKNFYFEVFSLKGGTVTGQMNAAYSGSSPYRAYSQQNKKPGGFGVFQFEDVRPAAEINETNGAWSCYIRNIQTNQYLNLQWREEESVYNTLFTPERLRFVVAFSKKENEAAEWNIRTEYSHHFLVLNSSDGLLTLEKNGGAQRWTLRLRDLHLEYKLDLLKFKDVNQPQFETVDFIVDSEIKTSESSTVSDNNEIIFSKENTFEMEFENTLAVGATVTAEVDAPGGLASFSTELRVDTSFTARQKNITTQTITYDFGSEVNIKENSTVKISASVDWNQNAEYPFEAIFYVSGSANKIGFGDFEVDTLNRSELRAIIVEKGFGGEGLVPLSDNEPYDKVQVDGILKGSFGVKKTLTIEDVKPAGVTN